MKRLNDVARYSKLARTFVGYEAQYQKYVENTISALATLDELLEGTNLPRGSVEYAKTEIESFYRTYPKLADVVATTLMQTGGGYDPGTFQPPSGFGMDSTNAQISFNQKISTALVQESLLEIAEVVDNLSSEVSERIKEQNNLLRAIMDEFNGECSAFLNSAQRFWGNFVAQDMINQGMIKETQRTILDNYLNKLSTRSVFDSSARQADSDIPIVLLPVRLETIFGEPTNKNAPVLSIRVYPDDIHNDSHEPSLTDEERKAGRNYHQQGAKLEPWINLVDRFGTERSAWIVRETTPPNTPGIRNHEWTRSAQAKLLPSRWLVMGYDENGDHLFDPIVGDPIPADLAIGPGPSDEETDAKGDWMLEPDKAEKAGMAVKIEFTSEEWDVVKRDGIRRLLVVGLREGDFADPQQESKKLENLLSAHYYTDGLDFIPQGTPTNNYAIGNQDIRSGYRSSEPNYAESLSVQQRNATNPPLYGGELLLARALGLDARKTILSSLDHIRMNEQYRSNLMNNLVWDYSFDYSLRALLGSPWQQQYAYHSAQWRKHFVERVRARGPFPSLRIGDQAYGALPMLSLNGRYGAYQYQQPSGAAEGVNLIQILRHLRLVWLDTLKIGKPTDIHAMLGKWLQIHPLPTDVNERTTSQLDAISEIRATIPEVQLLVKNLRIWPDSPLNQLVLADKVTPIDQKEKPVGLVEEIGVADPISYQDYINKIRDFLRNGQSQFLKDDDWQALGWSHIPNTLLYRLLRSLFDLPNADSYHQFVEMSLPQLEHLLLESLGLCSYRLDAWITSCATHRLETLRQRQPTGCYVGAYGWVENLKPRNTKTQNASYIFAPSAQHATTAAVLHSAHLSWDNDTDMYATDLSSRRIRMAKELLAGVRNGQSLSALLGYRVERRLQEANRSDLINDLRKLLDPQATSAAPTQRIDGMELLKIWKEKPPTDDFLSKIKLDLENTTDAINDLLRAESVFNLISLNADRAAATLDALNKGGKPPDEFHILHTPHPSISVTHRLLVLFDINRPHRSLWRRRAALSPRAQAEPHLNAWAEQLLGNLARVFVHVDVTLSDGSKASQDLTLAQIGFAEQMCGLDVVYTVASGRFEEWLKYRIWHYLLEQNEFAVESVTYEFGRQVNWSSMFLGMNEWIAIVQVYYELLKKSSTQPNPDTDPKTNGILADSSLLDQTHLTYPPSFTSLNSNIDEGELQKRIDSVLGLISNTYQKIIDIQDEIVIKTENGLTEDQNQIRLYFLHLQDQIAQVLGHYHLKTQFPLYQVMPPALAEQTKWLVTFNSRLTEIKMEIEKIIQDVKNQSSLAGQASQLRQLLGESFVMLPIFSLSTDVADAFSSAVERRRSIDDATPLDIVDWLQATAKVQERVGKFNRLRQYANNIATIEANFAVAQFPSGSTQDVWIGRESQYLEHDSLSIVAHIPGFTVPLTPDDWRQHSFAGVLIDTWTEKLLAPQFDKEKGSFMPPKHPAAMSIYYDQPGAVAPQSVLVAVHSHDAPQWNFVDLEAILLETMDLAQIRTVSTDDLEKTAISNFLPLLYLPTT